MNGLYPQTTKNTPVVEQVGVLLFAMKENAHQGEVPGNKRILERTHLRVWTCLKQFGGGLKEVVLCSILDTVRKRA